MPYIQIKISDSIATLLEEARITGSGFELKSTLHGLELQIEPGAKPNIKGSFSNFKVVAEPQIVIEERQSTVEEVAPQAEPSKVIAMKLPHSKEVAIENRRNLLVACLQRARPGISQAEIKELLHTECGIECSTTTVNSDLNELKKSGRIISYVERGIGTVYKVVAPSVEALGF